MGINKIEIRLEVYNVRVQRSCNRFLNPWAPFLLIVWTIVIGLNVSRSANINGDSTIDAECVVKEIVVVSYCCNHTDHKSIAFGDLLVGSICVTGDGVTEVLRSISTEIVKR